MTKLLSFLNIAIAFTYNLISIPFTCLAWIIKIVGTVLVTGADAALDLLNQIGGEIYANQLNAKDTNTNRPKQ
jgi:hypothetical protein